MIKTSDNTFYYPYNYVKKALQNAEYEEDKQPIIDDLTFLRLYLYKCMNTLISPDEVVEYCSQEYLDTLNRPEYTDERIYDLSSLQKDKYFQIIHYYKGLQLL